MTLTIFIICFLSYGFAVDVTSQQESISDHTSDLELFRFMREMKQEISDVHKLISKKDVEITSLKKRVEILEHANFYQNQAEFVSFTASVSGEVEIDKGEIIIFDNEIVNYGSHYDTTTGIFTCPYDAYYSFFVTILSHADFRMAANLKIDGTRMVRVHARDDSHWDSSSNLVVTFCRAGQQVWVEGYGDGDNIPSFLEATTFSGTLLRIA